MRAALLQLPCLLTAVAVCLAGPAFAQEAPGSGPAPSALAGQVWSLVASCGCCCFWLVLIVSVVISTTRGSRVGMWFGGMPVVRAVSRGLSARWARIAGRRRLEGQLLARTANPRDSRARYNLGVVYMEQRRWSSAAEELRASLEINRERADAHYRLARCLCEMGEVEAAVEAAAPCLDMRDDHYDALLLTGECLLTLGRNEEARGVFDRFLQPRRDDVAGWYWRGRVEEAAGDAEAAARWYYGAIERARHTVGPNRARDRHLAALCRKRLRGHAGQR